MTVFRHDIVFLWTMRRFPRQFRARPSRTSRVTIHQRRMPAHQSASALVFHGWSTADANAKLISDVKAVLDTEAKRMQLASPVWLAGIPWFTKLFTCMRNFHPSAPFSAWAVVATTRLFSFADASLLVAFALLLTTYCLSPDRGHVFVAAVVCLLGYCVNAALLTRRLLLLRWEKMDRIRAALREFECAVTLPPASFGVTKSENGNRRSHMRRMCRQAAKCFEFHTSNKVATAVLVYRDSEWIRLPTCLLVQGDVIALLQGELKLHADVEFEEPNARMRELQQPRQPSLETSVSRHRSIDHYNVSMRTIGHGVSERVHQATEPLGTAPDAIRRTISFPNSSLPVADPGIPPSMDAEVKPSDEVRIDLPPLPTPAQVRAAVDFGDAEGDVIKSDRLPVEPRRHSHHHNGKHRSVRTYVPPAEEDMMRDIDTLKLCGGMRRYYVMNTPMVRIIRGSLGLVNMDREKSSESGAGGAHKVIGALAHLNIPRPPFLVELRALTCLLTWSQIVVIGLVVVGACVRSSLTTAFHAWSSGVLEAVSVAIVLLAPLILPAVMQFAESCGTAHVLAYLEAAVIRARWKLKLEAHRVAMNVDPNFTPILKRVSQRKGRSATNDGEGNPDDDDSLSTNSPKSAKDDDDSASSSSDEEYEEPGDYKPRHGTFSGPSFASISTSRWRKPDWKRKLHYFKRVCFPWLMPSKCLLDSKGQSSRYSLRDQHRLSPAVVGFGVEEFAPPLVANLFLQRLADMTVFLCADRGTVCEDEPVADTILLPRGAKQLVILDLHADEASKHGVAFNDIFWKRHLSALKPIGLASMLASRMPLAVSSTLEGQARLQSRRLMRRKHHNLRREKRKKRMLEDGDIEAKPAENTPVIAAGAGDPVRNSASVSAPVTRAPSPKLEVSATVPSRDPQKSLLGGLFRRPLTPATYQDAGRSASVVAIPSSSASGGGTSQPSKLMTLLRMKGPLTPKLPSLAATPTSPKGSWFTRRGRKPLVDVMAAPGRPEVGSPLLHDLPSPARFAGNVSGRSPHLAPVSPSREPIDEPAALTKSDTVPYPHEAAVLSHNDSVETVPYEHEDAHSVASEPERASRRRNRLSIDVQIDDNDEVTGNTATMSPSTPSPEQAMPQRRGSDTDIANVGRLLQRTSNGTNGGSGRSPVPQSRDAYAFQLPVGAPKEQAPPVPSASDVVGISPTLAAAIGPNLSVVPAVPSTRQHSQNDTTADGDSITSESSSDSGSSTSSSTESLEDGSLVGTESSDDQAVYRGRSGRRKSTKISQFDWMKWTESDYGSEFDTSSGGSSEDDGGSVEGGDTKATEDQSVILHGASGGSSFRTMSKGNKRRMSGGDGSPTGVMPGRRASRLSSADGSDGHSWDHQHAEGDVTVSAQDGGHDVVLNLGYPLSANATDAPQDRRDEHEVERRFDDTCETPREGQHGERCPDGHGLEEEHHEATVTPDESDADLSPLASPLSGSEDFVHRSVSERMAAARVSSIAAVVHAHTLTHHHRKHHHHRHGVKHFGNSGELGLSNLPDVHPGSPKHSSDEASGLGKVREESTIVDSDSVMSDSVHLGRRFEEPSADAILDTSVLAPFAEDAGIMQDTQQLDPNVSPSSRSGRFELGNPDYVVLDVATSSSPRPRTREGVGAGIVKAVSVGGLPVVRSQHEILPPVTVSHPDVIVLTASEKPSPVPMPRSVSVNDLGRVKQEERERARPASSVDVAPPTAPLMRTATRRNDGQRHVRRSLEDIRSQQRLAECVRKVKPCHWLSQLALEIGFQSVDIDKYRHRKHSFIVACRGGYALRPIPFPDDHPPAVEEPATGGVTESKSVPAVQRGGTGMDSLPHRPAKASPATSRHGERIVGRKHTQPWLLPVVTNTIVEEPSSRKKRSNLQMFTQGYPQFVLPNCQDYWDGTEIWSMEASRRDNIVEVSRQWQQEGMVVHAFSYNPISVKEAEIVDMLDDLLAAHDRKIAEMSVIGAHTGDRPAPVAAVTTPSKPHIGLSVDQSSIFLLAQLVNKRIAAASLSAPTHGVVLSPVSLNVSSHPRQLDADTDLLTRAETAQPNDPFSATETHLHRMQKGQIFLGLVGARVTPKASSRKLVSHLEKAGVRFVYTSHQSYKRTKNIAGKLGLETDWNCAISLSEPQKRGQERDNRRPVPDGSKPEAPPPFFESNQVDEDEHFGEGVMSEVAVRKKLLRKASDVWDERAKLPHGIKEIRDHLRDIDDVPLQVRLFTESSTASVQDMIRIFQERGDIVAIVGTALVGSTPELCRYSDVAFCIGPPPNNTLQTNPSKSVQFPPDPKPVPEPLNPFMRFAATIAALPTSITIPHDIPLKVIVKVLTDARRSLLALKQCVFLAALGQAALAGIHVMNVWMGLPDVLPIHHTLWLLLFVVPLLSLSMLFCEPDVDDLSQLRTPPKRVTYPDTFVAPDKSHDALNPKPVVPPISVTRSRSSIGHHESALESPSEYDAVVRCLGYNDGSSYLCGHPDEMLIGYPLNDIPVARAVTPNLTPVFQQRAWLGFAAIVPAVILTVLTYCLALVDSPFLSGFQWGSFPPIQPTAASSYTTYQAIVRAQAMALLSFVLWLGWASCLMLQSTQSLSKMNPFRNVAWLSCALLAVLAHVCFGLIHTAIVDAPNIFEAQTHGGHTAFTWRVWFVALLWPVAVWWWMDVLKRVDVKRFETLMKRARLQFGTRLGRYSPR